AIPPNQVHEVAHEQAINIGNTTVKSWHTPGHAVHHIAWQLDQHLFAGDVAGIRIENGMVVPPCPPPDIHVEDWQHSLKVIRDLTLTDMYLTHFGKVTDIDPHLKALEENLLTWARWVKPHFEAGKKPVEVVSAFQQFVREELIKNNVPQHLLGQYESANPAFMSVAGLMRYWKKKLQTT
ncbi:MAG: MBL fold metallo-hydrolase, partial [Bacteroidota bacterium]